MDGDIKSIVDLGIRGQLVEIECRLSNNLPEIVIVGPAIKAVDEAKERVRAAFTTSSLQLPRKRITINLAPADLPKTDSSCDIAAAAAILASTSSGQILRHSLWTVLLLVNWGSMEACCQFGALLANFLLDVS